MKNLIVLSILAVSIGQASAIEFFNYKDATTGIKQMTAADLETVWNKTPVCIKDGAKIKAVNKQFKEANLGYRDCSTSDKVRMKHTKLGITVTVVPLYTLPKEIVKKLN